MFKGHSFHKAQLGNSARFALGLLLMLGLFLGIGAQQVFAQHSGSNSAGIESDPGQNTTLPLVITYFYATRSRGTLSIDWATGTETGNLGFNLYVENTKGRTKLNKRLIPSTGFTSHDPQDYHFESSGGVISGNVKFFLEDVNILGAAQLHGPFELDQLNGRRINGILTNWRSITAEDESLQAAANLAASKAINQTLQGRLNAAGAQGRSSIKAASSKATATSKPTGTARTPSASATPTPKPAATATATKKSTKPTATPRRSPTPTATAWSSPTFTVEATFPPTNTPVPSETPIPTDTLEPEQTETLLAPVNDTPAPATVTPEPVATDTPEATVTLEPEATETPMPTDAPDPTSTWTPAPSDTPVPTATETPAPTALPGLRIGDLLVSQTGIYRVSYADLLAAGLDLAGQPAKDLALTNLGIPVPILVSGEDAFGPGSSLEFFGQAIDTLYTNSNVYTLWVDHAIALRMAEDHTAADLVSTPVPFYMETALVNKNIGYDELSTTGDPWYNQRMLVYTSAASWNFTVDVDHYLAGLATASVWADVYGGTDYNGSPDHHILTSFNGTQLADQTINGTDTLVASANLPDGVLRQGSNTLTFKLPGDTGKPADAVYLDKYSVTYPRSFWAVDGILKFAGVGGVYQVDNLPEDDVVVYRVTNNMSTRLDALDVTSQGGLFQVRFDGGDQAGVYYLASGSALLKPTIRAARPWVEITGTPAEYLIISHPDFISHLDRLVQARLADGLTVQVVDVKDIYDQYSYGVVDPQAIKQFIAVATQSMGTQYVLLVGDDTYDYKNYLNLGSISFIPSIYLPVANLVRYAPVDPKYVDLNDDNRPDLPIGRFAVRTPEELDNVISKTLAYENKNYARSAVFAADSSFANASDTLVAKLSADWTPTRAYIDSLGVTAAHNTLLSSLNAGVALTNYIGHADDWEWTFNGLFNIYDAATLTNSGKPTLISQEGCWSNYYVNPKYETLVDAMMNERMEGAVGMFGSTMLASNANEQTYGRLLMALLSQPGLSIGQAELQAKQALAVITPGATDVFLGTMLLGDPYLLLTP
jgi:hypothetical protein